MKSGVEWREVREREREEKRNEKKKTKQKEAKKRTAVTVFFSLLFFLSSHNWYHLSLYLVSFNLSLSFG